MAIVQVKDLIEAGVHFGHRASRWNPKMRPYIYGKRNLIHIIDLRETVRGLLRAYRYLAKVAAEGRLVVFVGTKRQAREAIERESARCGMPRPTGRTVAPCRRQRSRASPAFAARPAARPSGPRSPPGCPARRRPPAGRIASPCRAASRSSACLGPSL